MPLHINISLPVHTAVGSTRPGSSRLLIDDFGSVHRGSPVTGRAAIGVELAF